MEDQRSLTWRGQLQNQYGVALGIETLRYGWPDTTEHRCRTAAEIATVLRRRGWPGALRTCGPACLAVQAALVSVQVN